MSVTDPKCPACGQTYHNHLGLGGVCLKLQEVLKENERLKVVLQVIRIWASFGTDTLAPNDVIRLCDKSLNGEN